MLRILITLILGLAPFSQAGALTVVTDIPPVHALVAGVAGETADIRLLYDGMPGSKGLSPRQQTALDGADLVIWVGPELSPALAARLRAEGAPPSLPLLALEPLPLRFEGWAATFADALPDLTPGMSRTDLLHAAEDGHDHGVHDHGPVNPFVWLDPSNAAWFVEVIRWQLTALAPANAETYRRNAETVLGELADLSAAMPAILAPVRRVTLIPSAEGMLYFLVRQDVLIGLDGAIDDVDGAEGIRACQFVEPGADASEIADSKQVEVDLYGASLPGGAQLYETLIRNLAAAVADCADK
ncbi:MAG: metal ABC transporter substrate-binding protein [Rhodobacter sp.]|nr:metal ABC transporter substrate-binding protein [Rhodobacter sp.]